MASKYGNLTFRGYRRENGRVGVRNHVIILPVDDISNAACEAVAGNIKGTLALPHAYGRLQFGEDLDLHFRTMIGTGANPNVAAAMVIGIEPGWTKRIVDGIAETGKPVAGFSIEKNGDLKTIMDASRKAKEFVQYATELQREECPISELWVSTKCGESDTTTGLGSCPTVGNMYDKLIPEGIYGVFGETSEITGAEHICEKRAANPEAAKKFKATTNSKHDLPVAPNLLQQDFTATAPDQKYVSDITYLWTAQKKSNYAGLNWFPGTSSRKEPPSQPQSMSFPGDSRVARRSDSVTIDRLSRPLFVSGRGDES